MRYLTGQTWNIDHLISWAVRYLSLGESRLDAILQLARAGINPSWIELQPVWIIRDMVNRVAENLKEKSVTILSYQV